jgi:hypothetical protein
VKYCGFYLKELAENEKFYSLVRRFSPLQGCFMTPNKYGLSRDIPSSVKRQVRQQCGFGCVICGLGIVQYEHVEPEFKDAKEHRADSIALLCPQCHAKITTKMWSKSRVKLAMRMPKCKQEGFAREFFDFVNESPVLVFGGVRLSNCEIPIEVAGYPLFSIKAPDNTGEPFLLSGTFTDSNGDTSLTIIDNEWRASSSAWDVEVKGHSITIREKERKIHLVLKAQSETELVVERLDMFFANIHFEANGDFLRVTYPNGNVSEFTGCLSDNCRVGMAFN